MSLPLGRVVQEIPSQKLVSLHTESTQPKNQTDDRLMQRHGKGIASYHARETINY